jgi:hypothetical protein
MTETTQVTPDTEPEKEWWRTRILFCNYSNCNGVITTKQRITKNIVRLYCENGCVDNLILDNKEREG